MEFARRGVEKQRLFYFKGAIMISQYLQQAIKAIEQEKENAVKKAVANATANEINPFNADIDKARDKALQEKTAMFNNQLAEHQQKFAKEKQSIVEAAEHKKKENAELVTARETAAVTIAYDKTISKLTDLANELNEQEN